jgi:hypothetical protein
MSFSVVNSVTHLVAEYQRFLLSTTCTQIIKLETETRAKSLISKLGHIGAGQIKLETGGPLPNAGPGRPNNKVGN